MTTLTVTTSNICGNPHRPLRVVRRRIAQAATHPGVNFGQELAPKNAGYPKAWRDVMAVHHKHTVGSAHEVPVSLPADWHVVAAEVHKLHGGKARVSPSRYCTVVRCTVEGRRVALVNMHTVSKPRRFVRESRWRIAHWNEYHHKAAGLIAGLVADGWTVVFGGDVNRRNPVPRWHPDQLRLVSSGLDHLWIVPAAGTAVTAMHTTKRRRTVLMDHPILSATFTLSDTKEHHA